MFRRLYWVTEQVERNGVSRVTGVYTSIPDLLQHGLHWQSDSSALRLTLTKLDSSNAPLGTWMSPQFEGISRDLEPYVASDEFSLEHVHNLESALCRIVYVAA